MSGYYHPDSGNPSTKKMKGTVWVALSILFVVRHAVGEKECVCSTSLNCSSTELSSLENVTGCNEALVLDASHNQLKNIDGLYDWFGRVLNVSHNQIDEFDTSLLGAVHKLEDLDVSWNKLTDLNVDEMTNLRILLANDNELEHFQLPIEKCLLKQVNISSNNLMALINTFSQCTELELLDVSHNKIDNLQKEVLHLTQTKVGGPSKTIVVDLRGNPLSAAAFNSSFQDFISSEGAINVVTDSEDCACAYLRSATNGVSELKLCVSAMCPDGHHLWDSSSSSSHDLETNFTLESATTLDSGIDFLPNPSDENDLIYATVIETMTLQPATLSPEDSRMTPDEEDDIPSTYPHEILPPLSPSPDSPTSTPSLSSPLPTMLIIPDLTQVPQMPNIPNITNMPNESNIPNMPNIPIDSSESNESTPSATTGVPARKSRQRRSLLVTLLLSVIVLVMASALIAGFCFLYRRRRRQVIEEAKAANLAMQPLVSHTPRFMRVNNEFVP